MSNFLAIATVTATLRHVLQGALDAASVSGGVSGAQASSLRPDGSGTGALSKGVNIYLYHVSPNAAYRNSDLPTRRTDGTFLHRPQVALDLHYLLSFYGQDASLEPQRLMGVVVQTLHSSPILTRQMILDTRADKQLFDYLIESDLADQVELVKLTPLGLSLEELSKLWSVFFQTPYVLSVAYQASVVLIEGKETPQRALPVRTPKIYAVPFSWPVVETIVPEAGPDQPILADSVLLIRGKSLQGERTQVRIAGEDKDPLEPISNALIKFSLSSLADALRAGAQGLQIVHSMMMGEPPQEHRGTESNVASFVLRPKITQKPTIGSVTGSGDGPYSGSVTLHVAPAIGRTQRSALLLNQVDPPSDRPAAAYCFNAPTRGPERPESDEAITFQVNGVRKGVYLVRVQIDGAESPLELVKDQNGQERYAGPTVSVP
jgi:hypothetical protein